MTSTIRVYFFPETIRFFSVNKNLTKRIASDSGTILSISNKIADNFISLSGSLDDVHKVRIILQEIEKNNYRKSCLYGS